MLPFAHSSSFFLGPLFFPFVTSNSFLLLFYISLFSSKKVEKEEIRNRKYYVYTDEDDGILLWFIFYKLTLKFNCHCNGLGGGSFKRWVF
jgi:hypothetical protein